jgi:hypothetical protein
MSSFTVLGFFALASGRRLQTLKPGTTTRTWHAHYTTTIQCINPPYLPADLRIYSPINDIVHADDTIAFVVARLYVPPTGDVLLDAIRIVPCPGDPSNDSYDETVPNFQFPMVYGLGVVSSVHETLPNGSTVFPVTLTEYVRDTSQQSNVLCVECYSYSVSITDTPFLRCLLNRTIPRWKNTPVPAINSVVHFYGICAQISSHGLLTIEIEGITLHISPPPLPTSSTPDEGGSPSKKRRFQTHASPRKSTVVSSSAQLLFSPM